MTGLISAFKGITTKDTEKKLFSIPLIYRHFQVMHFKCTRQNICSVGLECVVLLNKVKKFILSVVPSYSYYYYAAVF